MWEADGDISSYPRPQTRPPFFRYPLPPGLESMARNRKCKSHPRAPSPPRTPAAVNCPRRTPPRRRLIAQFVHTPYTLRPLYVVTTGFSLNACLCSAGAGSLIAPAAHARARLSSERLPHQSIKIPPCLYGGTLIPCVFFSRPCVVSISPHLIPGMNNNVSYTAVSYSI